MKAVLTDLTHQFILPLWDQKDTRVIDYFVSPEATIQTTYLSGTGPSALKEKAETILNSFTFVDFNIEDFLHQGNKFIYKWRGKAVQTEFTATPIPIEENKIFSGIISIEIEDGVITRYASFSDIPKKNANADFELSRKKINISIDAIEQVIMSVKKITGRRLTKREVECLNLWLKGFSIKETAKLLGGLSGRTIQTFRENIKRKMNVETYRQLFHLIQGSGAIAILLD